jgi:hypothetical protein
MRSDQIQLQHIMESLSLSMQDMRKRNEIQPDSNVPMRSTEFEELALLLLRFAMPSRGFDSALSGMSFEKRGRRGLSDRHVLRSPFVSRGSGWMWNASRSEEKCLRIFLYPSSRNLHSSLQDARSTESHTGAKPTALDPPASNIHSGAQTNTRSEPTALNLPASNVQPGAQSGPDSELERVPSSTDPLGQEILQPSYGTKPDKFTSTDSSSTPPKDPRLPLKDCLGFMGCFSIFGGCIGLLAVVGFFAVLVRNPAL